MKCFHGILCHLQIILIPVLFFCFLLQTSLVLAAPPSTDVSTELVLDLNQVIERARSSNRQLLQSGLIVQKNRYSLQSAKSEFDWQVRPVANLGYSKSDNFSEQATGISGRISKKSSFGVETAFSPSVAYVDNDGISSGIGLSLTIPLFRGFGKDYNYDPIYSADFAVESSVRSIYIAEVEKVIETVNLAYEVVRQQTLIDLYGEQDKRLNKHVVTIQLMETTGLGNQIDTYRAQIRQKDVQNQVANAKQQYQGALDRLKVLLALPVETQLKIKIPLSYALTKISSQEAEEIALSNRIEIDQAKAEMKEARRKEKVAKKRILPDLNFVATYRKNSFLENIDASESNIGDFWSIGFTSNTDVARSSERASYQQSLLNVRQKKLQQESQSDTIRAEVRNRLDALIKEAQTIRLREEQIVQARGKSRLAEIKFSHGMGGNFDFIEADTELQRAKANLLTGKINYIVGQYRLRAALGTLISRKNHE